MAKFKVIMTSSSKDAQTIGTFQSIENAAQGACDYAFEHGYTSSCDVRDVMMESLTDRNYYMLAYGPRELEIIETA